MVDQETTEQSKRSSSHPRGRSTSGTSYDDDHILNDTTHTQTSLTSHPLHNRPRVQDSPNEESSFVPVLTWGLPDPTISITPQEARSALIANFLSDTVLSELASTQRFLSQHVERIAHALIKASAAKLALSQVELEQQTGVASSHVNRIMRIMMKKGIVLRELISEGVYSFTLAPTLMKMHLFVCYTNFTERYGSPYASHILSLYMTEHMLTFNEMKEKIRRQLLDDEIPRTNMIVELNKITACFRQMMKDRVLEEVLEFQSNEEMEGNDSEMHDTEMSQSNHPTQEGDTDDIQRTSENEMEDLRASRVTSHDFSDSESATYHDNAEFHENDMSDNLDYEENMHDILNEMNGFQLGSMSNVKTEPISDEEEDERGHSDEMADDTNEEGRDTDRHVQLGQLGRSMASEEVPPFFNSYFTLNIVNVFRYWQSEKILNYVRTHFGVHCASIVNSIFNISPVYKENFPLATSFVSSMQVYRFYTNHYKVSLSQDDFNTYVDILLENQIIIQPFGDSTEIAVNVGYVKELIKEKIIQEKIRETHGDHFLEIYLLMKNRQTLEERRIIYFSKLQVDLVKATLSELQTLELVTCEKISAVPYQLKLWTLVKEYPLEGILSNAYLTAYRLRKRHIAMRLELNDIERRRHDPKEYAFWERENEVLLETIQQVYEYILSIDEWI